MNFSNNRNKATKNRAHHCPLGSCWQPPCEHMETHQTEAVSFVLHADYAVTFGAITVSGTDISTVKEPV